ncbi:MAG: hypothetical protein SVU32_03140, partial [Candidatus Nanohaloarchaea archaeon]|nr:hypothetical protein [Candidatus Nanohaloarchaea archaeon]
MASKDEVKQQYRELINEGSHKKRDLNYVVALSSALPVTQEIPSEIHKRAAWASNNGASFIELSIGGPSVIYNEWDDLLSISQQLGLSFDAHFPVKVPFDYSNPYREQSEMMGFFYGHEFMYKFIEAWGEFKRALESQEDVNGEQQHVYGINAHLVKSTVPDREERMARSLSVDPFGDNMWKSRIFQNKMLRIGFFEHYLWRKELRDNFNILQNIATDIEGFTDFNTRARTTFVDYMFDNGWLTEDMLEAVSGIGETEQIVDTIDFKLSHDVGDYDRDIFEQVYQDYLTGQGINPDNYNIDETQVEQLKNQILSQNPRADEDEAREQARRRLAMQQAVSSASIEEIWEEITDEHREIIAAGGRLPNIGEELHRGVVGNVEMYRSNAIQAIAGVNTDVPKTKDDLLDHRDGGTIAQNIPRFNPFLYTDSPWSDLIPRLFWELDEEKTLRENEKYNVERDAMYEELKQEIRDGIIERLESEERYEGTRDYMKKDESGELNRPMSEGEVALRDIVNYRGGQYRNLLSEPSTIFWYLMPWWMPFCGIDQLQYIWEEITGLKAEDYGPDNWKDYREDLEEIMASDDYDRIVAAGAGAYVWGHFTQFVGRGQDKTLVEHLDEKGLTMDWESHNVGAGQQGRGKLWKPHDIIKVCRAINNTPAGSHNGVENHGDGQQHDVMRCTIDMEHLARNGVDPLWVIDGNEEKGYRGLDEGDGKLITKQHVTHPALDEQQHHHMPIRRGDTLVYRHIESLVEKGFCQREDRPCVVMHELGAEKAESTFMLRLILNMLEYDISSDELESSYVDDAWERFENDANDLTLKDYMVLKFFGLTDEEWHHEWQEVFEHALDPLNGLLESASPDEVWSGQRAFQQGARPEDWEQE